MIGETISVIEPESGFARQHVPFLHSCRCFIKQAKTFFECLTKTSLLPQQRFLNERSGPDQFRIGPAHFSDQPADKPVHERLRSEEHTSELQSLMRISYAVFCLKKKKTNHNTKESHT